MSLQGEAAASREMGGKLTLTDVIVVNAYDIAVKNGFNGTEKEWLASLKGDKGDQGIQGEKGEKGDMPQKGVDYYTEAEETELVEKIETTVLGDIDTALDSILAVQDALIPKVILTFSIIHADSSITTHEFEEGMTWGEWADSKYNTIGAFKDGAYIAVGDLFINTGDAYAVLADYTIIANADYYIL